ncbi:DNA topoisomerase 1 beta [Linum perenne]
MDSDDDTPLVFKRGGNSASRQSQLNAPAKRPLASSQSANGQSSSNGQRVNKAPVASSKSPPVKSPIGSPRAATSKSPPVKSPIGSPKPSTSSVKASPLRSPVINPKSAISSDNRLVHKQNASSAVKVEIKSVKSESKSQLDDDDSEDEKPLSYRMKGAADNVKKDVGAASHVKKEDSDDDDDNVPLASRLSAKPNHSSDKKPVGSKYQQNGSTSDDKMVKTSLVPNKRPNPKAMKVISSTFKKTTIKNNKQMQNSKYSKSTKVQPSSTDGQKKWTTLVHNGVIFPPPYQPHGVKMLYKGKAVDLTPDQEEVATMFAVMKDTDYMQKPKFLENFWNDWRRVLGRNHVIQKLDDCDFTPIYDWHQGEKEKKKQMSTEVGNFRVEPPGLFRGRGEHPKMGKLKRRIRPSDITINIGKDAPIPECPIAGESWKEVKHDKTVTWLAFWTDPINPREFKYVFLAASSSLKGQSDKEKYEKARKLKDYIHNIRAAYTKDFSSKDVTKRQIAVATYLIDKLALRAGNEKDDDEADTVGCCTLKVSNVECVPPNQLKFDFLGKDSIRYENTVEVELPVFRAIGQFQTRKKEADLLFDHLDTSKLNAHLKELMPGLTAKVFRTYNASITLDEQLYEETEDGDMAEKVVVYQKANKQVAIICNHQRTVSKSHDSQMKKLTERIDIAKKEVEELKVDLERAKKGKTPLKGADGKQKRNLSSDAIEKKIASANQKIEKYEMDMKTKDDLKTVALGTSKINYLDPRITVAWCKRHDVPIEKIFNKSLLAKFAWAMDVDPQFRF